MNMDSDRFPLRDFGQAFFRVYGSTTRHVINVLQSVQMLMLVAVLILSNGGSISQISIGKDGLGNGICYVICLLIFAILGMVVGQIRTLQRFGWLANLSVWTTVTTAFIAIGISAVSAPNYVTQFDNYGASGAPFGVTNFPCGNSTCPEPVKTFGGSPPAGYASGGEGFLGTYQGINNIIYAYGGAMIFFNLMAEMRNPWDFWKGMICADIFIYVAYMFYGIFQYSYQGQYTYSVSYQSITPYNYQTACNILSIIGSLLPPSALSSTKLTMFDRWSHCCLLVWQHWYQGHLQQRLDGNLRLVHPSSWVKISPLTGITGFPPLTKKTGKLLWTLIVPMYWALAFVVGSAIPNFGDFTSLVGAFCIGNFTYAFPAMLKIGFDIKKGAMLPEESFDEATKKYVRLDGGMKRWVRGFKKSWILTSFNIVYLLGALVVCGLGMYSAITALIAAFGKGQSVATSFGCTSPFAA